MKIIFIFFSCCLPILLCGQVELVNQVIAIGGINVQQGDILFSSTAGEAVIGLSMNGDHSLTHGFQQNFEDVSTSVHSSKILDVRVVVAPNPSDGHFQLMSDKALPHARYTVRNVFGQNISVTRQSDHRFDLGHLSSGTYFLTMQIDQGGMTIPIQIIK